MFDVIQISIRKCYNSVKQSGARIEDLSTSITIYKHFGQAYCCNSILSKYFQEKKHKQSTDKANPILAWNRANKKHSWKTTLNRDKKLRQRYASHLTGRTYWTFKGEPNMWSKGETRRFSKGEHRGLTRNQKIQPHIGIFRNQNKTTICIDSCAYFRSRKFCSESNNRKNARKQAIDEMSWQGHMV